MQQLINIKVLGIDSVIPQAHRSWCEVRFLLRKSRRSGSPRVRGCSVAQ